MNVGVSVPLPAYNVDAAFMARKAEEVGFESLAQEAGRNPSALTFSAYG